MAMLSSAYWAKVIWVGDAFLAIASNTVKTARSTDGVTWTEYSGLPGAYIWNSMAWNGSVVCALKGGSSTRTVAISADGGQTWTEYSSALPAFNPWYDITWNGSVFAAVALNGSSTSTIATSPDGITWTTRATTARNHQRVAWNGARFATHTSGTPGYFFESADGIATWNAHGITGTTYAANAFAAAPSSGVFVSVSRGADIVKIMSNSFAMSASVMPSSQDWEAAAFGASQFAVVAYGSNAAAVISADGMTTYPATLPLTANWLSVAYGGGMFVAVADGTETAISLDDGLTWSLSGLETGTAVAPTTLTVQLPQVASAPTTLLVVAAEGTAVAPTALAVEGSGSAVAPTTLALVDTLQSPVWTARCIIDGVDVSDRLEGSATVTADEGAARIATLAINPPTGVIAPLDYVGKTITLDYVPVVAGTPVPLRLFTGRIDTPSYDLTTRLLTLDCVDDLQNRVASLSRGVIDGLTGGRYSSAVQGDIVDNWDYAQARLTTVAASLDAGPHGGMRVTPWELASTWATYAEADLVYPQSRITYPQRSTLINDVTIEFSYRYPRLRQRYTTLGWSGTLIDMAPCGYAYPTQQDILGAAGGSGWQVTLGIFFPAPAAIPHSSGGFIHPAAGSIDMAILHLTQRHSQTVTESYTLSVSAPESVAANGQLPYGLRGALASTFDGGSWESALDIAPLMPTGGEQDYAPDAPRSASDYAIQTLLDQARVKILGSHRGARVTNAVICNPDIDLDKKIEIATADMAVSGKVAGVVHTLDFAAGSALTVFSIACFGTGGSGLITPDTLSPTTPPAAAVATQDWPSAIPPLFVNTYGVTPYADGIMGLLLNPPESLTVDNVPPDGSTQSFPNPFYTAGSYPVTGFRVRMPGVDDADRNPIEKPVYGNYRILIPHDAITFTVP